MASITSRAVRIEHHGGPETLHIVNVQVGEPGPGEIRIRHKAVGLNFIDVYQRSGLYALPMPLQLGMEASGVIEAVDNRLKFIACGVVKTDAKLSLAERLCQIDAAGGIFRVTQYRGIRICNSFKKSQTAENNQQSQ